MRTSARCCCPAGSPTPSRWPSGCTNRQPISLGRHTCSAPRWRVGPHLVPANLDTACSMLEQAAVALSASGHAIGWGYRYHFPRSTALAIRGSTDEAAAAIIALDELRRPFRSLDYERSLARAWLAAGQGAVSEGIAILLSAAERAGASGQFAAEVNCLQIATQFGDRSGATRLRELESIVEGPRVGLAARFAEALRDGDAVELAAVSEEFERMGDLVAAVDAAAHAATGYRRQGASRIGVGMLDARRWARSTMRRRKHAGTRPGHRGVTTDWPRTRDRHVDRRRLVEPRDRRATDALATHRREPHPPRHEEDRNHQPRRTRQLGTSPLTRGAPRLSTAPPETGRDCSNALLVLSHRARVTIPLRSYCKTTESA